MIRYFCDKCKKEVKNVSVIVQYEDVRDSWGCLITQYIAARHDLCDDCHERFKQLNIDISDFMRFSEEELCLMECTFSVGDEVITSTGEIGVITDVCTCENCKERGFYEPTVETKIGRHTIYITNNDKRVNFRSFYKIGDRVYGNLDEDCVLHDIKRNKEKRKELGEQCSTLNHQLGIVRKYKNKQKEGR